MIPTWHRTPQILLENTPNSKFLSSPYGSLETGRFYTEKEDFITKSSVRANPRRKSDLFPTKQNSKPSQNHSLTSNFEGVFRFWGSRNSELFELMRSYWAGTRTARRRPSHTDQYELMNISKLSRNQVKLATHSSHFDIDVIFRFLSN